MAVDKVLPATRLSREPRVRLELLAVIGQLRQLQSSLAVAVSALRQQNADIDADVAVLLQRAVGDPLQTQIERLAAVLRLLSKVESKARSPRKNR